MSSQPSEKLSGAPIRPDRVGISRILVVGAAASIALAASADLARRTELPSAPAGPVVQMKAVTAEVIAILQQDIAAGQPTKVAHLVETSVLPMFDFPRMTSIAVARYWRLASPAQREALTAEFRTLLVRTYSVALSSYRDQLIEYLPLRAASGDTEVTVRSTIRRPGAERLIIDYEMERTPAGWKVYDIKIAGVSLVITYQATFAAQVRDSGVDGLIKSLSEKNLHNRPSGS